MRRKQVVKGFNNSQKIRVIIDGVGLYLTVGATDECFSTTNHRFAVQHTLEMMATERCGGIGQTLTVYDSRMVPTRVSVQVDLV